MLAKEWLDDHVGSATDAARARIAAASEALHDASHAMAKRSAAGIDYARAIGEGMKTGTYRLGRSTRSLVAERPLESVVIIGIAAFAIGWLWRRSRESSQPEQAAASGKSPPRRRSRA